MQTESAFIIDLLEVFRGNFTFITKVLVQDYQTRSKQTKEQAETDDNGISDGFIQRGLSSKEGVLPAELEKGWGDIVLDE